MMLLQVVRFVKPTAVDLTDLECYAGEDYPSPNPTDRSSEVGTPDSGIRSTCSQDLEQESWWSGTSVWRGEGNGSTSQAALFSVSPHWSREQSRDLLRTLGSHVMCDAVPTVSTTGNSAAGQCNVQCVLSEKAWDVTVWNNGILSDYLEFWILNSA